MTYFRSLLLNILVVFFVNRISPGIHIETYENVPNVGADLLYAILLGFLNASIFPFLVSFIHKLSIKRIIIAAFLVSFGGMGIVAAISHGVVIENFGGYLLASTLICAASSFSNYLEWCHAEK